MAQVIKSLIEPFLLIDIFHFMTDDHETEIAHESASTYFQCGPFY